ncbi:transmembrane 9 superfamily member 11-like protein [Tanacetum coccineum]
MGVVVHRFELLLLISCLFLEIVYGYYLPGSFPHKYDVGDRLYVKVNSLTSIDTEIPYGYYTLPFCKPLEGIKDSAENIGELLMGERIENSPYRFKMFKNESEIVLCKLSALSSDEFKTLRERIDEMYQVNLNLDNLPAIRYTYKDGYFLRWTGYPVGIKVEDIYYVFNHLKLTVLVHRYEHDNVVGVIGTGDGAELITRSNDTNSEGYMVVGFEVQPCSVNHDASLLKNIEPYGKYSKPIKCDPSSVAMAVTEGHSITYTYEVSFVMSDIRWPSRWDAYLKMEGAKVHWRRPNLAFALGVGMPWGHRSLIPGIGMLRAKVHWFSILNSLMVITFLAGAVLIIFLRTIRRDLAQYEELDHEAQTQMNEELSGWKLVVSDVFRAPDHPQLLCVMVADGCRILGMAFTTIFFAALGFMSPASRGALISGMLMFYLLLGVIAGFVAVWLQKTLEAGNARGCQSTGAIPFTTFIVLILLWFCISIPLTIIGGFIATRVRIGNGGGNHFLLLFLPETCRCGESSTVGNLAGIQSPAIISGEVVGPLNFSVNDVGHSAVTDEVGGIGSVSDIFYEFRKISID